MMREQQLAKRAKTLHTLDEAVTAMKSLSAHHFLLARRALEPAREYRSKIDELILQIGLHQKNHRQRPNWHAVGHIRSRVVWRLQ